MTFLEVYLLAIVGVLLAETSWSDVKTSKIPNRSLLIALSLGLLGVIPYYVCFASACFFPYCLNTALVFGLSLLLYGAGIWGAGDSKLLGVAMVLFPARLYCAGSNSLTPCFLLLALIFVVAFLYIGVDTVYLGIQQRNLFQLAPFRMQGRRLFKAALFFFLFLNLCNAGVRCFAPAKVGEDAMLMASIRVCVLLLAWRWEPRSTWKSIAFFGLAWVGLLVWGRIPFPVGNVPWYYVLIIVALILGRSLASKYNYKTIPVAEIQPGMILSMFSSMRLAGSTISGLPGLSSEDLNSRLTPEEVAAIKRWSQDADGATEITVVRKIPFALFIALGTLIFAAVEVLN